MRGVSFWMLAIVASLCATAAVPPMPSCLHPVGDVAEATMHWRLRPHGTGAARWGIIWNLRDSLNYDAAEVEFADAYYDDALGRTCGRLRLLAVRAGRDSLVERRDLCPGASPREGGYSLRLRLEPNAAAAVLEAGYAQPEVSLSVGLEPNTRAGFYSSVPADTLRCRFDVAGCSAAESAPFADVEALRARLASKTDAGEGEWVYYDRNTDPLRLSLGGDYRIATLADGNGGYTIIYLDGAVENADAWTPLRVKGRLRPTGFVGQYDLEWLDAFGMPMGADCSAMMTDGSLLDLRFPLYKSSVRFRRVLPGE